MRQGNRKAGIKAPTFAEMQSVPKIPKIGSANPNTLNPKWSFKWIDIGAPWCWSQMESDAAQNVYPRLGGFESMTWIQIQQAELGHPIPKDDPDLLADAPKRLEEIGKGDYDLYSLRVTGAGRIWGIKVEDLFYVLWWDPAHAVYPYKLKHT